MIYWNKKVLKHFFLKCLLKYLPKHGTKFIPESIYPRDYTIWTHSKDQSAFFLGPITYVICLRFIFLIFFLQLFWDKQETDLFELKKYVDLITTEGSMRIH